MELADIIARAATHENAKAYAETSDQYLFAEQLLLDANVYVSVQFRLEQAERIVGMMEQALIDRYS